MLLRQTKYAIRDCLRQITRHKFLSFLTIVTIAITLSVFSIASLIAVNSYNVSKSIESQLRVVAFLKQPSDPETNTALLAKLEKTEHIENVEYVSKKDALKALDKQMSNSELDIEDTLSEDNPLPDSFQITVDSPENIESIAKMVEQQSIVDSVNYGRDIVDSVVSFNKTAAVIGCVIIGIMILATLFLISTTIQLTVNNRKDEIQIMRMVGAKNSFIKRPFILEGVVLGAFGAIIAGSCVYGGYEYVYSFILDNMPFLSMFNTAYMLPLIIIFNLVVGVLMGSLGSLFAVRKYLKV